MSAPPPATPRHHQHLSTDFLTALQTAVQNLSAKADFNTLLSCFMFLVFFPGLQSSHTAAENGYTSKVNDLEHCREGEGVPALPAPCDLRYRPAFIKTISNISAGRRKHILLSVDDHKPANISLPLGAVGGEVVMAQPSTQREDGER